MRRTGVYIGIALVLFVLLPLLLLWSQSNPSFPITADCGWTRTVTTWNDANADGIHDAEEAPLAGVKLFVNDMNLGSTALVGGGTTNENGEADLFVFIPGCPETAMQILAEPPVGFCLTTSDRVKDVRGEPVAFGAVAC